MEVRGRGSQLTPAFQVIGALRTIQDTSLSRALQLPLVYRGEGVAARLRKSELRRQRTRRLTPTRCTTVASLTKSTGTTTAGWPRWFDKATSLFRSTSTHAIERYLPEWMPRDRSKNGDSQVTVRHFAHAHFRAARLIKEYWAHLKK